MKFKIVLAILITTGLGIGAYYEAKEIAKEYFYLGVSKASDNFTKCPENDDSAKVFPEYFQACKSLCNSIYSEKPICVSSINDNSVTCVCEQTESK